MDPILQGFWPFGSLLLTDPMDSVAVGQICGQLEIHKMNIKRNYQRVKVHFEKNFMFDVNQPDL